MRHLYWHKSRLVILKPKTEGLRDGNSFKSGCLFELSRLLTSVGNQVERKQVLTCVLKLERERGSDYQVAQILRHLANANRVMRLPKEGMQLAKEALEISERLGDKVVQAQCLTEYAELLCDDGQFDAAEGTVPGAVYFFPEKGERYRVCGSHRTLARIHHFKGEREKAIHHYEVALRIASPFGWHSQLFWVHYGLASLLCDEAGFDDAQTHTERAKSHTVNSVRNLGYAMEQAWIWYKQHRLEEAQSEVLRATDVCEKLGLSKYVEECRTLLRDIQKKLDTAAAPGLSDFNCELLRMMLFPACIDFSF